MSTTKDITTSVDYLIPRVIAGSGIVIPSNPTEILDENGSAITDENSSAILDEG